MNFRIQIPQKTFLAGEYLALTGGPSLILTTTPEFVFTAKKMTNERADQVMREFWPFPFHQESPAGHWIEEHWDFFKNFELQLETPTLAKGGFGRSTAEFLGCFLFYRHVHQLENSNLPELLLQKYKSYFKAGTEPSGADLLAQFYGGLVVVEKSHVKPVVWPFSDKDVFLFKTNHKVATHEHLKTIEFNQNAMISLRALVGQMLSSLENKNWTEFLSAQKQHFQFFKQNRWVFDATQKQVQEIQSTYGDEGVLARGCGAMGADVIAIFASKNFDVQQLKFLEACSSLQYVSCLSKSMAQATKIESWT